MQKLLLIGFAGALGTLARYGLTRAEVQEVVEVAVGGREAGLVFEGDRRVPLVVRLPEATRTDLAALARLPIPLPVEIPVHEAAFGGTGAGAGPGGGFAGTGAGGGAVPLGQVALLELAPGPNQISRESGKRLVMVTANVRGRDIGSFVEVCEASVSGAAGCTTVSIRKRRPEDTPSS